MVEIGCSLRPKEHPLCQLGEPGGIGGDADLDSRCIQLEIESGQPGQ